MPLTGIMPPVITPFLENGDVDFDACERNIVRWNSTPLSGYLLLGSNSETPYLSEEEKLTLIDIAVRSASPGRFIMAGTGLESTRETIRFTNLAARHGAQAALILTPCYYANQMTDASLVAHFSAVADAADIPVLIYNVPKFTHVNISPGAVRALSNHPTIIGMKDSSGDIAQLRTFKGIVPESFSLLAGSASILYDAVTSGVRGGVLALANCAPAECAAVQHHVETGLTAEARAMQERLAPVNKAVTDTYGIAGLKYACTLRGFEGGSTRRPLLPLSADQQEKVRSILKTAGLLE